MSGTNPYSNLTDEELLLRYKTSNDNSWLGILLQRYTLMLLGVGMKYLKDKVQAQDAVQHVFLKMLTYVPQTEIQNFKGWLYILMRNHCLQLLRDRQYFVEEAVLDMQEHPETDMAMLQQRDQTLEEMKEALNDLTYEQSRSIKMFYLQKLSYDQIIEQTGYTFGQVKSYIQNGKRNLKLILLRKQGERPL